MSRIALVVAGGDPPPPDVLSTLPPPVITIAADSGIHHARALDVGVDILVGDLDSADEESQQWAVAQGATVEVYPADKDQTDLELALDRAAEIAAEMAVDELIVLGLGGGRLDHWLANLLTLAGPRTASVAVTAYVGPSRISVIRDTRELTGRPGELVSLVPVGGAVHGITTAGLEYPLRSESLHAGSSRGISNVFGGAAPGDKTDVVRATVDVVSGTLLAIQPEYREVDVGTADRPGQPGPTPSG